MRPSSRRFPCLLTLALGPTLLLGAASLPGPLAAAPAPVPVPVVKDDRLAIALVAREPDIVTPVGLAVDRKGRLFVVESNTHFRLPEYKGAPTDRIKIFQDRDGDGKYELVGVFAEGFTYAMNLAFAPDGALYLTERGRVVRLEDRDGDGKAERATDVVRLETPQTYPHNGLGGILFGPDGALWLGLGENRGTEYTLRGSDGRGLPGGGEGGNVFRCKADGSACERFATGFWNPFALGFHGNHLLAIDDDPEVRPPDRLLDVVRGADFGFKFRYGQAADHPFQSWKGELPGTLGMAGAIGEGATGLLPTAKTALPADYGDKVLVDSWSDRRIEVHTLKPKGASLQAQMSILVQGGGEFRPVALAAAPDGSIFVADWVKRRYEVHGHGRIWRIAPKSATAGAPRPAPPAPSAARLRLEALYATKPGDAAKALPPALRDADPYLRTAAAAVLAGPAFHDLALKLLRDGDARVRLGAALALRQGPAETRIADGKAHVAALLADKSEEVRLVALAWAAEDALLDAKASTSAEILGKAVTTGAPSRRLVEAYRAAASLLNLPLDDRFQQDDEKDRLDRLAGPAKGMAAVEAQREALWGLVSGTTISDAAGTRLEEVALDRKFDAGIRADAAAALAMGARVGRLAPLLADPDPKIRVEGVRALRAGLGDEAIRKAMSAALTAAKGKAKGAAGALLLEELRFALGDESIPAPARPTTTAAWRNELARGGDPDAGRRVFVNPGAGCARCHRVGGLGGWVGPPLTYIGNERPDRLLESLLEPSADVVWPARVITARDGSEHGGMISRREPDGSITLTNAAGLQDRIAGKDIVSNREADASLMPDGLQEAMTVAAFRDLWAFLRAQNR